MAWGGFKDLPRRAACDKVLHNKAFDVAKNSKYDGYQHQLASMVYKCFDKKSATHKGTGINSGIKTQQLADKVHNPITRNVKNYKVYSSFEYKIWGGDLADMQLVNKYNKGIQFLLYAIDIFSKYAWVVPLKDKKGITITNAFQNILRSETLAMQDKSSSNPNKHW